ncbi:hypothetical protein PBY51_007303 [Eleginops maclovinus]|uniref:Amine oxidase n=1 Tax=Eleginops maclovinus TaxID=56733 RepID=A0AAN7X7F0_ELEMC|nr:hypothetical protein PBY51_007303 [Eleginops maclovinus]
MHLLISTLLLDSFGIDLSANYAYYENMPSGVKSGERQTWFALCRNEEGFCINPVGLEILCNHQSTDYQSWLVLKVLYNGQYFDSILDLKQQYEAGTVQKIIYKPVPNYAALKSKNKPTGNGPQQFYVQGERFSIKNNHIAYLDWSFAFGLSPLRGMRVFDVRLRRERIIFELTIQEAIFSLWVRHPKSHAHQIP